MVSLENAMRVLYLISICMVSQGGSTGSTVASKQEGHHAVPYKRQAAWRIDG